MNELEKKLTELEQQRQTVFIETFVDERLTGKFSTSFFNWSYNKEENGSGYDLWIANNFIAVNVTEISVDLGRNTITINYQCVMPTG